MVQQAARAESPPPLADLTVAQHLDGLGRDWTAIRGCRLRPGDRGSSPIVLIHPGQGVAVLDVSPSETPDAVDAVRTRLGAARFEGIFAGHLPVVHVRATARQMPALPKLLDDAFAALPPLSLPGGDAWAGVAARALLAEHPPPHRVQPQPSGGGAEVGRPRRTRRRRRGRALRRAAAFLLCSAALGGFLAVAMKDVSPPGAPTLAADPSVAAATSVAVPSSPPENTQPQRSTVVPTARPAPEPVPDAPPSMAPSGGGTAAPGPEMPLPTPPPPDASTPATPPRAVPLPPSSRRPDAPPPQTRRPPDRAAAPPPQQRRQQQQEAGADAPPGGAGAVSSEAAPQRCRRVAARIGSGASLGEADMRFFNEACIRW